MKALYSSLFVLCAIASSAGKLNAQQLITRLSDLPDFVRDDADVWVKRNEKEGPWGKVELRLSNNLDWASDFGIGQNSTWIRNHRFMGVVSKSDMRSGGITCSISVLLGKGKGKEVEFLRPAISGEVGLPLNLPVFGVVGEQGTVECLLFGGEPKFLSFGRGINLIFDPSFNDSVLENRGGAKSLSKLSAITTHVDDINLYDNAGFLALHREGRAFVGSIGWGGCWVNHPGGISPGDPHELEFKPKEDISRSKSEFKEWAKSNGKNASATVDPGEVWLSSNVWNGGVQINKTSAPAGPENLTGRLFRVKGVSADDTLNLRSYPSSEDDWCRVVVQMPNDAKGIKALSSRPVRNDDGEWMFVAYSGLIGWSKFKFLQPQ